MAKRIRRSETQRAFEVDKPTSRERRGEKPSLRKLQKPKGEGMHGSKGCDE